VARRRASVGGGAVQACGLSSNAGRRGWWWCRKHGRANGWQCKRAMQAQVELRARRGGVRAEGGRPQQVWCGPRMHARFGRARMELRCDGSGQTRTEGSKAEHGGSLARAAAEGPVMRQGRGECGSGNKRKRSNRAGQRRAA
jgi:hypothetical protein